MKLPVLKMGHVLARRRPGCLMVLRVLPLCPAWCSKFLWKKRDVVLTVEWCVGWEVQFDEGDFLSFYLVEGQMECVRAKRVRVHMSTLKKTLNSKTLNP